MYVDMKINLLLKLECRRATRDHSLSVLWLWRIAKRHGTVGTVRSILVPACVQVAWWFLLCCQLRRIRRRTIILCLDVAVALVGSMPVREQIRICQCVLEQHTELCVMAVSCLSFIRIFRFGI